MVSVRALASEKAIMIMISQRLVSVSDPDERIRLRIQKRHSQERLDVLEAQANAERQAEHQPEEQVPNSGPSIAELRAEGLSRIRADFEWRRRPAL